MVKTERHIMDITLDDLYANYRKKPCQAGCGVYCAVSTSLLVENPAKVVGKEIVSRAKRVPSLMRNAFASSYRNPDGTRDMHASSDGAPAAKGDESLVGTAQQ